MATTSATSFSYLSTANNRFSGLASGMDIDSIVEKLMKAESAKMEKLQQQKQKYEWQRDAYRSVNTKLETFRTDAFDKFAPSTFAAKTASVSDTSRVTATATSEATGTLNISKVESLATSAQEVRAVYEVGIPAKAATGSSKLADLGLTADGTFTMKVYQKNGSPVEKEVSYSKDDTIDSFLNKLNKEGLGVTAMFGNGKMSLTSNATGEFDDGTISVSKDDGKLFSKLGFLGTDQTSGSIANGTDAKYTVNGVDKTSKTNSFSELGYNITLNRTFEPTETAVTISSSTDTDKIVDQVKAFVDMYNGLIDSLNSSVNEKKNYDYSPLTDAQKADMSDDQIKTWEGKSQKGLLRNDTAITKVLSQMRASIYGVKTTAVSEYNALYNIGVTTSGTYSDNGKLEIDEDKLRKAITANPDAVAELFGRAEGKNGTDDKGGLINQLRSIAKEGIDTIAKKAGKEGAVEDTFTLGKNIKSVTDRIAEWKEKLETIENRYFKQFTAMEQAISNGNSQSSLFA